VAMFMKGRIPFVQIEDIIERVMEQHQTILKPDLEAILEIDSLTRKMVYAMIE
jgi:1-deoxy-D-xylulose-5-phosphate reductoisomerase